MSSRSLIASVSLLMVAVSAKADDWTYGRGTWYDDNQQGSCHDYKDIPEWYAAWPDTQYGFATSCGTCWEVACYDTDFQDGYGEWMHRSNACKDTGLSIKLKIVDSCPCVHQNFYSNQRWCCGDMHHIDMGRKVFEQLADLNIGVIGLKWRQVACDYVGPARIDGKDASSTPSNNGASSGDGAPVTRTQHSFGELFAAGWMGQTLDDKSTQQSSDDHQSNNSQNSSGGDSPNQASQGSSQGDQGSDNSGNQYWQQPTSSQSWQPFWTSGWGQWKRW